MLEQVRIRQAAKGSDGLGRVAECEGNYGNNRAWFGLYTLSHCLLLPVLYWYRHWYRTSTYRYLRYHGLMGTGRNTPTIAPG